MKFSLSAFGGDLLKVLSIVAVVAKEAEPIVDLTNPGVAQIYNLSTDQGVAVLTAFTQQQVVAAAPAPAVPVAAAAQPAPVDQATSAQVAVGAGALPSPIAAVEQNPTAVD